MRVKRQCKTDQRKLALRMEIIVMVISVRLDMQKKDGVKP